jgi:hypothetical protein
MRPVQLPLQRKHYSNDSVAFTHSSSPSFSANTTPEGPESRANRKVTPSTLAPRNRLDGISRTSDAKYPEKTELPFSVVAQYKTGPGHASQSSCGFSRALTLQSPHDILKRSTFSQYPPAFCGLLLMAPAFLRMRQPRPRLPISQSTVAPRALFRKPRTFGDGRQGEQSGEEARVPWP